MGMSTAESSILYSTKDPQPPAAFIPVETLLQSEDLDLLRGQIQIRKDLRDACLGSLYKGILADQIIKIHGHWEEVTQKPKG